MLGRFLYLIPVMCVAGCASTQLNYNTLDLSSNIDSLVTKQALVNLSKFIDDPNAIPSQVDLSAGTIQTSNAITPSVTFPLTNQVAEGFQLAKAVTTLSGTTTTAGAGAGLSGTNIQQQNWNVSPLTDANTLRNLQALYKYAVYGYPLRDDYTPSRIFFNNEFFPDPYQLQPPHCVLCTNNSYKALTKNPSLHVNPKLHHNWIYWTADPNNPFGPPPGEPLIDLGYYGSHELYMTKSDYDAGVLTNFVFFLLPNSEPVEVFATGGKDNLATAAPSTNGRVNTGSGRHNFNILVPQGIQGP
jgi:hypothetical protein